ncbi:MAG: tubulin-like doman-containing protein, partial [Pseudomonadota bacterium]
MAIEMDVQPTLLVGVGGTGSRIADRILKQVRQNNDVLGPGIRMLAVDTDEGDLEKLTDVPKDSRIRISEPEFVYRTLQRNAAVMDQWCYRDTDNEMTEDIKGKSLIVGAGQIRMLTRLALHDRLTHGHIMETMEAAISRLAVHSEGLSEQKGVRIIMICSLGGATGSGSFIQLALVLRKAAENRGVLPMMRGLVLLPDIFNRSGKISQDEWDDLLSNGYAAMKELNAVNLRADLRDFPDDFTFEYAPGHFAGIGTKPFEEVVFIDYENSVGGSMGQNLDAYVNMAARSAYLNIFTPLGPKIASQSINRSRTSQRNLSDRQLSSYSGIGIAGL